MQSIPISALQKIERLTRNSLYINSLYLGVGKFADAGFGFLFWIIAAHLYSITDVGIATALVSSLGLIMSLSRFGYDTSIIRFMPSWNRSTIFNSCLWITTIITILISTVYLVIIEMITPEIAFITSYIPIFMLFTIMNSFTLTTGNAFLSFREAKYRFLQNLVLGSRVLLLFPLVIFGSLGIFFSIGFAYLAASFFAVMLIRNFVQFEFKIDRKFVKETFSFSMCNYIAGVLQSTPILILPILALNMLGSEQAALYYTAAAIGNLVQIIPDTFCTSFFVEASHGMNLKKGVLNTLKSMYALQIPVIIITMLFSDILLGFFGTEYIVAKDLLVIITLSTIFVSIYTIFIPIQNVRLHVKGVVLLNLTRFILLLSLSYCFICMFGLIGAGLAWMATYILLTAIIIGIAKSKTWI